MRTFAALLPPDEALDQLADTIGPLRRHPSGERLRWAEREDWHITLAFFGETDGAQLPVLYEGLADVARDVEPFSLRLVGGGAFGRRHLWAGVAGDLEPLTRLAFASAGAGRAAGAPGGTVHDAYRPHLTLARNRDRNGDLDHWLARLAGFEGVAWTADSLVLMRSEDAADGAGGTRYRTQASWPLEGR
ncbi:RNA 2',3'-cyclic phosphodiesterase [Streptomyces triticirhizae]|uniref:RNA 2',3'-cyclic phosphodiesterase n=1 Tax=Streptomyces triticirhizae TaxID=2483353 RepID=A0A3M2M374_9ACTN|nr:RNA 2',3'-cyclic phosphodiesterase [Streptomyces triticirhizae]RMI43862.1 RNA 2',3'-cyclic phosphodiesterase [Streptomyces triticirhizae]